MNAFFEQFIFILTIGGIVQGPYLALLLISRSIRKSRANLFLAILLTALSFSIAHILYAESVINHLSAEVYSLGDPTFLLIAPLLWLYTSKLTGQKISWPNLLHFIPFFLIILFSLTFYSVQLESFAQVIDRNNRLISIFFWLLVVLQFSLYHFFLSKKLIKHRRLIREEVSNPEGVDASWIKFFMAVFLFINLFFLFSLFAIIHLEDNTWHARTTAVIFSLSVYALGYRGILQKEVLFSDPKSAAPAPGQTSIIRPDQKLLSRLLVYMEEKKPYLDPELTLTSLAKDLDISRTQLSQLINAGIGNNFYDFVNKYRVEEVKRLMADPQMDHFSLLGIALEAGFKSKSTFNLIFKRFTGITPSEYHKNISD